MAECQRELMIAGNKPYPRTCELCGLFGPCRKGLYAASHPAIAPPATTDAEESVNSRLNRISTRLEKVEEQLQRLLSQNTGR